MLKKIIFAASMLLISIIIALLISCETFQKVDYRIDKDNGTYNQEHTVVYK